jgi:hypothetical protein
MAREDSMPKWVSWSIAIVGFALLALVASLVGGFEGEDGISGILAAIGGFEFVLALGAALFRRLFDHSDEKALQRLRGQMNLEDGEAEDSEEPDDRDDARSAASPYFSASSPAI